MAYIAMAYIVMAHVVMAYIVMAYIVMAYTRSVAARAQNHDVVLPGVPVGKHTLEVAM